MHTNGIVGCSKNNLAYNYVEDIELRKIFVSISFEDSKVIHTYINAISHSKEVLILCGCIQGFMDLTLCSVFVAVGCIKSWTLSLIPYWLFYSWDTNFTKKSSIL